MKIDWRRRAQRQIGRKEGLVVVWREVEAGREALVLRVSACANPECPCDDVHLDGVLVGHSFLEVRRRQRNLVLTCLKDTPRTRPERPVSLTIDVRFGAIREARAEGVADADLAAWMATHLDDDLLDFLHDVRSDFKGLRDERCAEPVWREGQWARWTPSKVVSHEDAYPLGRWDGYTLGKRRFYALLHACANPDCDCTEATVDLVEVFESGPGQLVATLRLDVGPARLPPCPEIDDSAPGQGPLVDSLWDAFLYRHKDTRWLRARAERVREFGRRHLLPAFRATHLEAPRQVAAKLRVGRNDPCPCGSGKKYKRCCGG